ncbi:hypothetical protein GGF50DRAFT_44735 [Schizophyllum commune]
MPRSVAEAIRDACTVADIALLRGGHIPSDSEAVAIERKANELKKIDLELAEKIAGLQADQEAIRRQVAVHRALVSPYRRVPPEILSEIFILALPEDWQDRQSRIGTLPRILAFAQVCTSWRAVALTMTPQLWTTLSIDIVAFDAMQRHPWALEMELAKAGQALLDLRIWMPTTIFAELVESFWLSKAWSQLLAQSHRWQRLSLHGAPLSAYNDLSRRAFPSLTHVSIDFFWQHPEGSDVALPLHLLEHATHVTELHIEYTCIIQKLELPRTWIITSLDLDCRQGNGATLIPCLEAIKGCRETLETCALRAEAAFEMSPAQLRPTLFPHLRTLCLFSYAMLLSPCFTVPNLDALHIYARCTDDLDEWEAISSLLNRSEGCRSLRLLELHDSPPMLSMDGIVGVFECLPHLKELVLGNNNSLLNFDEAFISPQLLHILTRDENWPHYMVLLPVLARLTVMTGAEADCADYSEYRLALQNLLLSRQEDFYLVDGSCFTALQYMYSDVGISLE